MARIGAAALAVVSPGVPPNAPPVVAGVDSFPLLAVLFMLASLAYLLWYIGLAARFSRLAKNA